MLAKVESEGDFKAAMSLGQSLLAMSREVRLD